MGACCLFQTDLHLPGAQPGICEYPHIRVAPAHLGSATDGHRIRLGSAPNEGKVALTLLPHKGVSLYAKLGEVKPNHESFFSKKAKSQPPEQQPGGGSWRRRTKPGSVNYCSRSRRVSHTAKVTADMADPHRRSRIIWP